jgi:hypothetical protein
MVTPIVQKRNWQESIVIPSARVWCEESVVLAAGEMQIPRSARDDNPKSATVFREPQQTETSGDET